MTTIGMPRDPTRPDRRRTLLLTACSVALCVFVFLLRFNTLGGALGGFDDDHFVPFAYAKQVQAGDQPLRDFTGIGLQGVWPSLTFELSAWAQSLFGNNLRSEALLSVTGIAVAAVLAFVAAAHVASIPIAFAATIVSTMLATRLYNYPKVLVLAASALLLARFARRPGWRQIAALGAMTVVAFLFRHDYAILVGAGVLTAIGTAAGSVRHALRHVAVYALVVLVLMTPSLIFVQRYAGIPVYLRDSVIAVRTESGRTARRDATFVSRGDDGHQLTAWDFLSEERNAVQWLYYAFWVLPLLALAVVAWPPFKAWQGPRAAIAAWGVMALAATPGFLRGNTGARFGDLAPLAAVLLAGVLGRYFRAGAGSRTMAAASAIAVVPLAASVWSAWVIGGVAHDLDVSGWWHSPVSVVRQAERRWTELRALPREYWAREPESPSVAAVQYLHACTSASDRVMVISYQPELLPLADRRFAAGRASVVPGLLTDDAYQRQMVEIWDRESVPLVLVEPAEDHAWEIPILYHHLIERYVDTGPLRVNGNKVLHVYADRQRTPSGMFDALSLPCFH